MHEMTESCPKKTNIAEISPHLICALCGGYLIDATTIVECLHSFCKTCIVRYLESSKYCPICEVLVHKTRPLQNIRLDHTLQDIVYKLVPGLFKGEMRRRREFYKDHPTIKSAKVRQEQQRHRVIFTADEQFSIALEFCPDGRIRRPSGRRSRRLSKTELPERRYLLCPAGTTVALLKKFMKLKFALPDKFKVDIFHSKGSLLDHYSMMDVAYIYSWKREGVLQFYYSVYKVPDPIPEIRITEAKNETCIEMADDTGQKADDTRPSTLFNKATLLGNHSVDRNIPHDLSPLELIATVANDICIQEGRGHKRKTEEAQLYEVDDENSSTETRQLQKSIERAIDLCSNSNQGSPAYLSAASATIPATSVQNTRTSVSESCRISSNSSVGRVQNDGVNAAKMESDNSSTKTSVAQANGNNKTVATRDKPKKTDTASQCDPRPKKQKGEGHLHNHSKASSKVLNVSKQGKSVANISNTEKKTSNCEMKVSDKSVSMKTNVVNNVEQNGETFKSKSIESGVSTLKGVETPKETQTKGATAKAHKTGPKRIDTPTKEITGAPKLLKTTTSLTIPNSTSVQNKPLNTVTKPSSAPVTIRNSNSKTANTVVPNKSLNSQNKIPSTMPTTKLSSTPTPTNVISTPAPSQMQSTLSPTKLSCPDTPTHMSSATPKISTNAASTKLSVTLAPTKISSTATKELSTITHTNKLSSAATKTPAKFPSAQVPNKVSNTPTNNSSGAQTKSSVTLAKVADPMRSATQLNGHSSSSELVKQQNKGSNITKAKPSDQKD